MTVTVAEPTMNKTTLAGDLLLARLLPATSRRPAPRDVRADVGRFFRTPLADEPWQSLVDELVEAGLLTTGSLQLTQAGRSRALEFLGVTELPPKCYWKQVRTKFLLPKALGLDPTTEATQKRLKKAENVAASILKQRLGLPGGAGPTLGKMLEALVCRKLGFPEATTLVELKRLVLSQVSGSEKPLSAKELNQKVPRVVLGVKQGAGFADVLLDGWADAGKEPAPIQPPPTQLPTTIAEEPIREEFDLPTFAATVKAAARDCPTGRFGDNKVFINHVWRHLRNESSFPALDLPAFKEKLVEANNARLLTLSRADLVEVMNPADVQESQTRYLNAEFNFILVEKEQP